MSHDISMLQRILMYNAATGKLEEVTVTGNPATFTTNVAKPLTEMTVSFTPSQNLHGYDKPWPSGSNINKLDETFEKGSISEEDGTNEKATNCLRSVNFSKVIGGETYYMHLPGSKSCILFYYSDANVESYVGNSLGSVTSGTVNIPANANYVRIKLNPVYGNVYKYDVGLNYPSTNTAYSPYANICPIDGYTECTVYRASTNQFDNANVIRRDGYYIDNDGVEHQSSGATSSGYTQSLTAVKPSTEYTLVGRFTYNTGVWQIYYYNKDKQYVGSSSAMLTPTIGTFTTPYDCYYIAIAYETSSVDFTETYLNFGSTALEYEAHKGINVPIVFSATGKNLLNPNDPNYENCVISLNGEKTEGEDRITTGFIPVEPEIPYRCKNNIKNFDLCAISFYDEKKNFITQHRAKNMYYLASTSPQNAKCMRVSIKFTGEIATPAKFAEYKIQLEKGESMTAYEPFTNIVYGGNINSTTEELTASYASEIFDGSSDEGWAVSGTNTYVAKAPLMLRGSTPVSSAYIMEKSPTSGEYVIRPRDNNIQFSTMEEWKAYLEQNPMQVVYELTTPITYQLEPFSISSLKGNDVIWSDTVGTNEITYRKKKE